MNKTYVTLADVQQAASLVASMLMSAGTFSRAARPFRLYGVPRGGIPAALAVAAQLESRSHLPGVSPVAVLVSDVNEADAVIDDLIDSGATLRRYAQEYPDLPFYALFDKQRLTGNPWLVMPWESNTLEADEGLQDNIRRTLQYIGEDVTRGGLLETPARVERAYRHWFGGYEIDPASVLKTFEDGAERHDQMITVCDIPFYSHCEHHMAPFFGTATVAYIPRGAIVGLSKLSRIVDVYARRLQVQERMTDQIADALEKHLDPIGVGVMLRARHMCMESRGVRQQGHHTVTTALRGALGNDPKARQEFLLLCRGSSFA